MSHFIIIINNKKCLQQAFCISEAFNRFGYGMDSGSLMKAVMEPVEVAFCISEAFYRFGYGLDSGSLMKAIMQPVKF